MRIVYYERPNCVVLISAHWGPAPLTCGRSQNNRLGGRAHARTRAVTWCAIRSRAKARLTVRSKARQRSLFLVSYLLRTSSRSVIKIR